MMRNSVTFTRVGSKFFHYEQLCRLVKNDSAVCCSKLNTFADDNINVNANLNLYLEDRKHCRKTRKYRLPAFSPFPQCFAEGFFLRVVSSWDFLVKSEKSLLSHKWTRHCSRPKCIHEFPLPLKLNLVAD